MAELERRAELVKSGVMTAAEDKIADRQATKIEDHFDAYVTHMQARGRTTQHIAETRRYLNRVAGDCEVTRLSDLQREGFDRWLAARRAKLMGARNLNAHRVPLVAFCNWCISVGRMTSNPLSGIPKADEKSDRRRQRRAMTEFELHKLLAMTAQRPLQEAMTVRRGSRKG